MIKLLEQLNMSKIDVLIKTSAASNKVEVYNEIRAVKGVVVVTVEQSQFLDTKATNQFEYSLLHIKYLNNGDPKVSIDEIKKEALITTRIDGLLQFIPRYQTIKAVKNY
jgi:hypothetical protein